MASTLELAPVKTPLLDLTPAEHVPGAPKPDSLLGLMSGVVVGETPIPRAEPPVLRAAAAPPNSFHFGERRLLDPDSYWAMPADHAQESLLKRIRMLGITTLAALVPAATGAASVISLFSTRRF